MSHDRRLREACSRRTRWSPGAWVQKLCYYVELGAVRSERSGVPAHRRRLHERRTAVEHARARAAVVADHDERGEDQDLRDERRGDRGDAPRSPVRALNNRLGFVDICQLDAANQVGVRRRRSRRSSAACRRMATAAAARSRCCRTSRRCSIAAASRTSARTVAPQVIDAKPNPNQPGAKKWSSSAARRRDRRLRRRSSWG